MSADFEVDGVDVIDGAHINGIGPEGDAANNGNSDVTMLDEDSDDELDRADELLQQLASGKTLKRASDTEIGGTPKVQKLAEDEFMGKFGSLEANYASKRIDVKENCIHEVCLLLVVF